MKLANPLQSPAIMPFNNNFYLSFVKQSLKSTKTGLELHVDLITVHYGKKHLFLFITNKQTGGECLSPLF